MSINDENNQALNTNREALMKMFARQEEQRRE